jgi:hypothetical protein
LLNWSYYALNGAYYPPNNAFNDLLADTSLKTERVKLDVKSFTYYFKSIGALQNAWIVVALDLMEGSGTFLISKEILESVANVGHSIYEIFAYVIINQYSCNDETHGEFDDMHAKLCVFSLSLQDVPSLNEELQILFSALTNFHANFNQWTPCISSEHMLLYHNFVKLDKKMKKMIAKLDTAWKAMKSKMDEDVDANFC